MPYYKDQQGNVQLIENPDLNPGLISGKTQTDYQGNAITGADLTTTPSSNFQQARETPIINPYAQQESQANQLGTEGQKAQDTTAELQGLFNQVLGESGYRAQQEQQIGLEGLMKTQTDLSSRLNALKNESLQIPLQLQQDATGRGVTAAGLQPIQTAALRNNAIQALGVSSLLEASRGNLSTALDLVDRAVYQKFQPIKEQIAAKTANLNLILQSPAYTAEQKSRAQKQIDIQDAKSRAIEKQETTEKDIRGIAIDAASSGADSLILRRIQEAKTPEEALRIAADAGVFTQGQKINSQVVKLEDGNTLLVNTDTGEVIKNLHGSKPITTPGGGTGGSVGSLAQSIIENPTLFDDLTPTKRGQVIAELQAGGYDTTNLGVKGLSDGAIKELSQTQQALRDLDVLKEKITGNEQYIGPITGLQRFNPFSKARQIQADVDRVKQTVGKALEGGVLRKEDEDKYKKILATLADTPETAIYKIDALISSIQRNIEDYKTLQQSAGRSLNARQPLPLKGATPIIDLRAKYDY